MDLLKSIEKAVSNVHNQVSGRRFQKECKLYQKLTMKSLKPFPNPTQLETIKATKRLQQGLNKSLTIN
jgi:hypothetical protein